MAAVSLERHKSGHLIELQYWRASGEVCRATKWAKTRRCGDGLRRRGQMMKGRCRLGRSGVNGCQGSVAGAAGGGSLFGVPLVVQQTKTAAMCCFEASRPR